ncbi:Spy/CpxP family protein refolding chaperone [Aminobacter ciceronei]|jgi:protein CpxP|uniref:Spy/CpxP family protein refolding chaperone n=1 Tax=Aminobacter ciceronei TaxID=150723 RepID=UPI003F72F56F
MDNDKQDMQASSAPNTATGSRGWGRRIVIGGLAAAAVAGIGLAVANSGEFGDGHGMLHFGQGHQMMDASMGRGGFSERRMEHMMEDIDATPEQSKKLKELFGSARDEIAPMLDDFRDTRNAAADILGAPTIDRSAIEKLRSERVAAIDAASRKMTATLVDAAEILTPEQRAKILERFNARGGHGRW